MTRAAYDAFLEQAEKNRDLADEAEERFSANSKQRDHCDELLDELDLALLALDHPDFVEPRNWVVTRQREVNQERAAAAAAAAQASENHASYISKAEMFAKAAARVKPAEPVKKAASKKAAGKDSATLDIQDAGITTTTTFLPGS